MCTAAYKVQMSISSTISNCLKGIFAVYTDHFLLSTALVSRKLVYLLHTVGLFQ